MRGTKMTCSTALMTTAANMARAALLALPRPASEAASVSVPAMVSVEKAVRRVSETSVSRSPEERAG